MAGVPNHIVSVLSLCVSVMFMFFCVGPSPQTPSLEWAYGWGSKSYSVSFKFVCFYDVYIFFVLDPPPKNVWNRCPLIKYLRGLG